MRRASSLTRTRPSSRLTATRHIRVAWLDLRAEPIVLSVPAVEKSRYYAVMLCDGNTFNYGYIGSRATGNEAGRLHGRRTRLERRDSRRHQEGFPFEHAVLARGLPHAAFQCGRHAERGQGPGGLQGATTLGLSSPARATGGACHRLPEDQQQNGEDRLLRIPRLRPAVCSARAGGGSHPCKAGPDRRRCR